MLHLGGEWDIFVITLDFLIYLFLFILIYYNDVSRTINLTSFLLTKFHLFPPVDLCSVGKQRLWFVQQASIVKYTKAFFSLT